jgi:hypothetical protein
MLTRFADGFPRSCVPRATYVSVSRRRSGRNKARAKGESRKLAHFVTIALLAIALVALLHGDHGAAVAALLGTGLIGRQ